MVKRYTRNIYRKLLQFIVQDVRDLGIAVAPDAVRGTKLSRFVSDRITLKENKIDHFACLLLWKRS